MNSSSTERRPFKILRPTKHSTAMVIARYSSRQPAVVAGPPEIEQRDLVWKALRLGVFCAACAFAFFVLSKRNLVRNSEIPAIQNPTSQRVYFNAVATEPGTAPVKTPALTAPPPLDAKRLTAATLPPVIALPQDKNLRVTEFVLAVSPEFQNLGRIQVRLSGVNPAANSYDITVRTRGREFYRQDVPLNEPLRVQKHSRHSPEIVVGAIAQNRVYGYIAEHGRVRQTADEDPAPPETPQRHRRHRS